MTPDELHPTDDRRPVLQPPRFGLLTLLAAVGVVGAICAITHYFGSYGAAIAILFTLCVAAHVAGNAIGTNLRDFGGRPEHLGGSASGADGRTQKLAASSFAPLSRLGHRYGLGKTVFILAAAGAVLGGVLGFVVVHAMADEQTAWHVFGLGIGAAAVLGGIWTFAAASFVQVTLGEFLQARRNSP